MSKKILFRLEFFTLPGTQPIVERTFARLLKIYLKAGTKESFFTKAPSVLSKKEMNYFLRDICNTAYVDVSFGDPVRKNTHLKTMISFNHALKELFYRNAPSVNGPSLDLSVFEQVGYNNLDIVENPQSAALMFTLG